MSMYTPEYSPEYFLDCVLATVDDQAMTKSRKKKYYKVQLEAAQNFYLSMKELNLPLGKSRATDVELKFNGCIYDYAQAIENKHNVPAFKSMDLNIGELKSSLSELLKAFYDHAMTSHDMATSKSEKSRQLSIAQNISSVMKEQDSRQQH